MKQFFICLDSEIAIVRHRFFKRLIFVIYIFSIYYAVSIFIMYRNIFITHPLQKLLKML